MTRRPHAFSAMSRQAQRGLTLIEFMVSIVLGMIVVAALATLIADQSSNRAEIDRAGRLIENGRYAVRALADDAQLAGYWGELNATPAAPGAMPDPCNLGAAQIEEAMGLHVQGYNDPLAGAAPTCISQHLPGTDILVVRRADPDTTPFDTAGAPDLAKVATVPGQILIQTGLVAATGQFGAALKAASGDAGTNTANFPLVKKDSAVRGNIRRVLVRIYYISRCSVLAGGSCNAGDNGNPIPTLKMLELSTAAGVAAWSNPPVTIAEGVENLQIDYGVDTDGDGAPDGADVNGAGLAAGTWPNVMTLKIHLVARSLERTPGYVDDKTYRLGTAGTTAATNDGYKRHVFVQSVRLVNPSGRRTS